MRLCRASAVSRNCFGRVSAVSRPCLRSLSEVALARRRVDEPAADALDERRVGHLRGTDQAVDEPRRAEMSRGLALNSMTWSMWPTPSEVSIPSSFSACTTVRGNPSRMKPLPQSGVEMLSLMMPITCDRWGGGRWAAGAKSRDAWAECGGREQRGLRGSGKSVRHEAER